MQVPGRGHQGPRMLQRDLVERRPAVGRLGHVREGELAVLPAMAMNVEYRIDVVRLDVHPDRMHGRDRLGRRRGGGDEVDVVGDVDLRGGGRQVVDHVVNDPVVVGPDRVPVALRELVDGLLLPGGGEWVEAAQAVALTRAGRSVAEPYPVVKVNDVDPGDGAAALAVGASVVEVRRHPDHVAVLRRLGYVVLLQEDQVRSWGDQVGAGAVMQMLDAVRRRRQRGRQHKYGSSNG